MKKFSIQRPIPTEPLEKIIEKDLVLDERKTSPSHAHELSILPQAKRTDLEPPVLWLDGRNCFNPYKISEISRNLGLDPERALREIQISRAFTCHQMTSLILEKLEEGVERFEPGLAVITGLPELFLKSNLAEGESLRTSNAIAEKLENTSKSGPSIFLATVIGEERNKIIEKIETASNHVIRPEERQEKVKNRSNPLHGSTGKNLGSEKVSGTRSLEEFA